MIWRGEMVDPDFPGYLTKVDVPQACDDLEEALQPILDELKRKRAEKHREMMAKLERATQSVRAKKGKQ